MNPYKALLLIADISGFTQFMKMHTNASSRAKQVVVELLNSIIAASSPPLKLAELEGDAVFFYAACEEGELEQSLAAVKAQVIEIFRAFHQALHGICEAGACASTQNLRLKIVVHLGEVAIETIRSFEKLFGIDVILVHRLLKNSVPSNEYVLMTEALYDRLDDFYEMEPERHEVECDGIGTVNTVVFYPSADQPQPKRRAKAHAKTQRRKDHAKKDRDVILPKGRGASVIYRPSKLEH